jgi:protein-S-isoprenylcysteine O-methyltransferase Ste14
MHGLELRVPPPVVFLVTAALMWFVARALPLFAFVFPARDPCAAAIACAGIVTAALGVIAFRRARTTLNPLNPEASTSLVVSGIYARTRNPMYLGLLLILTGWAVYLSNILVFLLLPAFVLYLNRFQIEPEERALAKLFGQSFAAYQARSRRWL